MRFLTAIAAVSLVLLLAGCGGDEATTGSGGEDTRSDSIAWGKQGRFATITGKGAGIEIDPPGGPLPDKPRARDLEVGSGPVARNGDSVYVNYLGVDYKTGVKRFGRWLPLSPLYVELGSGNAGEAWEEGIEGMRVGGRRELIIPSELLFNAETDDYVVDYVVELARIERAP